MGDIHGCATRLRDLHDQIAADLAARPIAQALLIHLGDLIDRGPASAEVLARLAAGAPLPGLPSLTLRGNHEQLLLAALETQHDDDIDLWLRNGGVDTLDSYGLSADAPPIAWAEAIGPATIDFLHSLPLLHRAGGYLFVHAGIRPGVPLENQTAHDLLWIREPFLGSDADLGAIVVHGHTPVVAPLLRANRIALDTGAYFGGDLTCAVLKQDRIGFLQA